MTDVDRLVVVDLAARDLERARELIARAFTGEPFKHGMYGESVLDRFVGSRRDFATWPSGTEPIAVGVALEGVLVGVGAATRVGLCAFCDEWSDAPAPEDPAGAIEHEFELRCRLAHRAAGLPPHGHIRSLGVEPALHGAGIGRVVVAGLLERLRDAGSTTVTLECIVARSRFYEHLGFVPVHEFDDPGGSGLRTRLLRHDD